MSNQTEKSANLGTYLKRKRVERGLTQSEVATKLGYGSPQFISNIERGISSVPLKSLKVVIDLYELPAEEVLDVLVSEKKNYWREQLGIGQDENPYAAPTGNTGGNRGQGSGQEIPANNQNETPILYSSNIDRPPESGV